MRTIDFEKAVAAIGCELLRTRIQNPSPTGGRVIAAYGQVPGTLTYIMWDENGRGFVFSQDPDGEDCVSEYNMNALPYERDEKFDLKFE